MSRKLDMSGDRLRDGGELHADRLGWLWLDAFSVGLCS